ncbi:RNA/RNP complex-1-interacting phosphatase [Hirschfeldia incana]|nr:RNA/RNP complex-1-interacting phosphatase [Hirschfeldia incana]
MTALTTFYHPLRSYNNHRTTRQASNRHSVRSLTVISCRKQKSPEESQGVIQRTVSKMISEAEKIGKKLKPEKKGDMKDLMLMSLSFAVYVYISQLMVCAYFAWTHVNLPNPSW